MSSRRLTGWSARRLLGILFLIPGLLRIPLPQADYHNIRHHDGAGEVCPYHDHLLRWHPTANLNEDVAVLHWHWLLPASSLLGPGGDRSRDGGRAQHPTPALHADLPNCVEPDWNAGQVIRSEGGWRSLSNNLLLAADNPASGTFTISLVAPCTRGVRPDSGDLPEAGSPAPLARVERWNC